MKRTRKGCFPLGALGACLTCLAHPGPYNKNHGPFEPEDWPDVFRLRR